MSAKLPSVLQVICLPHGVLNPTGISESARTVEPGRFYRESPSASTGRVSPTSCHKPRTWRVVLSGPFNGATGSSSASAYDVPAVTGRQAAGATRRFPVGGAIAAGRLGSDAYNFAAGEGRCTRKMNLGPKIGDLASVVLNLA